jgi:hypothetical protein
MGRGHIEGSVPKGGNTPLLLYPGHMKDRNCWYSRMPNCRATAAQTTMTLNCQSDTCWPSEAHLHIRPNMQGGAPRDHLRACMHDL